MFTLDIITSGLVIAVRCLRIICLRTSRAGWNYPEMFESLLMFHLHNALDIMRTAIYIQNCL